MALGNWPLHRGITESTEAHFLQQNTGYLANYAFSALTSKMPSNIQAKYTIDIC